MAKPANPAECDAVVLVVFSMDMKVEEAWRVPRKVVNDLGRFNSHVNGIKIGPPHTLHETIRAGQGAGFSHWESRLIFTLPQGVNNGPETIVTLRHSVRPPIWRSTRIDCMEMCPRGLRRGSSFGPQMDRSEHAAGMMNAER